MAKTPLILITNDDGITAPGIRSLIHFMRDLGDVVVVAPDSPQSGMGHAITVNNTLYVRREQTSEGTQKEYSTSGTPADCVKLAKHEILDRTPDLCVSGINHGSNASINVLYSGTMSAAIEACIEGIPAIGFSLCDYSWNADFSVLEPYVKKIAQSVLEQGLPLGTALNVNFPSSEIKGMKVCRQAKANWIEKFDKRQSPMGQDYYWLTGEFKNLDQGEDTDQWALDHGFVSIVPVHFDMTSYAALAQLDHLNSHNE
jgi:5'-nucleotidase